MGNHRADTRTRVGGSADRPVGGRRKATRYTRNDRHPLTGLPMIPTVAGAVEVSVAEGGAVTAGIAEATVSGPGDRGN